jgi:hypothetical protein
MRIETERQAREYAKAATFGECQDVDGFMRFWQDPWLRAEIHRQAGQWSRTREDYQDLWGEAWASVCELGPDVSRDEVWHVDDQGRPTKGIAYRAMHNEYNAQRNYRRRFSGSFAEMD